MPGKIPYKRVYIRHENDDDIGCFIPGHSIEATITHAERPGDKGGVHLFSKPYVYTIKLEHGGFEWTIQRKYKDFKHLHNRLLISRTAELFRAQLGLGVKEKGSSRWKGMSVQNLPSFPRWPEVIITNIDARKEKLQEYLSGILNVERYRNRPETAAFLEVCRLSFVEDLGLKYKEGIVKRRPGGRKVILGLKRFCIEHSSCCYKWEKRWLLVKDSCVFYINPRSQEIRAVMLFDEEFAVVAGAANTGVKAGLMITNLSRELKLKCESERKAEQWRGSIERAKGGPGSIWLQKQRFESSFPVRDNSYAQWFVDAKSFMDHAANMMELAHDEIFISDWWLSPEVHMKRPVDCDNKWRLDALLKRKAEQGVKVFVLLYKEVEMALGINSLYSKKILESLHPNIRVIRHPDHTPGGTFVWTHHEKLICVDQCIAFVGGIDLCFGRWDDHRHKLDDLGSGRCDAEPSFVRGKGESDLKGETSANEKQSVGKGNRFRRLVGRVQSQRSSASGQKSKIPRLAQILTVAPDGSKRNMADVIEIYQDCVASGEWQAQKSKGDTPPPKQRNLLKRMVGRWKDKLDDADDEGYQKGFMMLQKILQQQDTENEGKLWIGKDYVNFIFKDFIDLDMPLHDFIDRSTTPRMPWHDIHSVCYGAAARDVARHFIQRWNTTKVDKVKQDETYPFLIPKSYRNFQVDEVFRNISSPCHVQVLRSASQWSTGLNREEKSIQQAYLHMITNAQHYIYIENQFFVSMIESNEVKNEIAQAILNRIIRAEQLGEKFRVYVVLPLMPAFEGQLDDATGGDALKNVLHWTYQSISCGPGSLITHLSQKVKEPSKYVVFCGLRKFTQLTNRLVTELLYIHSKLILVDDKYALIGSANINDRSQMGVRDSEMALYMEDYEFEDGLMDGKPYKCGTFAGSLRKHLFKEHLGQDMSAHSGKDNTIDVTDPVSDRFYTQTWMRIASRNTGIFEEVFRCLPTDEITTFDEHKTYKAQIPLSVSDKAAAEKQLATVQGSLVLFPTRFMSSENLVSTFLPSYLFT